MVALYTLEKMFKNLSKQTDYDKQLLNGKVIQKTLTSD